MNASTIIGLVGQFRYRQVSALNQCDQFALAVMPGKADKPLDLGPTLAKSNRHAPAARVRSQRVLEGVDRGNISVAKSDKLVVVAHATAKGVA